MPTARTPRRPVQIVIHIDGEPTIRLGILEGLAEQDLRHGVGRRLDAARPRQILLERLAYEISERHSTRPRNVGGAPVKISRQEQLGSMHV